MLFSALMIFGMFLLFTPYTAHASTSASGGLNIENETTSENNKTNSAVSATVPLTEFNRPTIFRSITRSVSSIDDNTKLLGVSALTVSVLFIIFLILYRKRNI